MNPTPIVSLRHALDELEGRIADDAATIAALRCDFAAVIRAVKAAHDEIPDNAKMVQAVSARQLLGHILLIHGSKAP